MGSYITLACNNKVIVCHESLASLEGACFMGKQKFSKNLGIKWVGYTERVMTRSGRCGNA